MKSLRSGAARISPELRAYGSVRDRVQRVGANRSRTIAAWRRRNRRSSGSGSTRCSVRACRTWRPPPTMRRRARPQSVGRSRSAATNLLRLLQLTPAVQDLLLAGDLDMGHARALLTLEGADQVTVAHEVVAKKLSVRETESLVSRKHPIRGRQGRLL